ncbi:MAG: hypothetical protein HZB29_08385 [Nitrospinae bacterium]|nr:hypothetical protein [Nitrospinota bacterium]
MTRFFIAFLIAAAAALAPGAAEAIPAFSKKYEVACSACHSSWPRLNDYGMKFKINGYQLPDSEDGGQTAKLNPGAGNLFLDIGKANPPISMAMDGGITLLQSEKALAGDRNNQFFCCVNGVSVTADMGGTVAPNIAYWLSLPWGKEDVSQANLRFVNWFGPGLFGMDIGAMKVVDYDVVGAGREWFGSPLFAFYGHPGNSASGEMGMTAVHNDTGVRVYGRPSFGMFSYEAGMYTGSQLTSMGEDDADKAFTAMGRVDTEKVAVSLRYWTNKTGLMDQTVTTADGQTLVFAADKRNPDETTQEIILSARYRHPYFEVDATLDRVSFTMTDSELTSSDGTVHTLSMSGINRTGISVSALWFVNNWMETGLTYGQSKYSDYDQTVDGIRTAYTGYPVSMFQWRLLIKPAANMKLAFEAQVDTSSEDSRKRSDGTSADPDNKFILQWSMSL